MNEKEPRDPSIKNYAYFLVDGELILEFIKNAYDIPKDSKLIKIEVELLRTNRSVNALRFVIESKDLYEIPREGQLSRITPKRTMAIEEISKWINDDLR